MRALGRHILIELYDCDKNVLNNFKMVEDAMIGGAKECRAHVVQSVFHKFNPHGVSGVVVIAESHLAVHTWPEYGYAAVDLFTCGDDINPWIAYEYIANKFRAKNKTAMELNRGSLDIPEKELKHKPMKVAA